MTNKVVLPIGKDKNDREVFSLLFGTIPARVLFRFCELIAMKLKADNRDVLYSVVGLSDELAAALDEGSEE